MAEFEAAFPFEETPDQLSAIEATKRDMAEQKPMDRLICGDVGYGKTEIAIRAAFKAVDAGKQVAVLVPTTILAEQHHRSFSARMGEFPFNIEVVNRFRPRAEVREVLKRSAAGGVDILIGTHRILQKDVAFKDLGLVVIDEEQRFGVEDKEWLKTFRSTVDVLTLSATPIPRTLHMSLLGIRDISNLETPPPDRKAIETRITRFDPETIKRAIHRELNRDGQVYFVHNRIYDIESVADRIQSIVPEARIAIGHGQMSGEALERTMLAFIRRKFDILVATTIIESGLDIPNVNTIFINEADKYGLADLHQLRGRVGRYKHRAYAYSAARVGQAGDAQRGPAAQGHRGVHLAGRRFQDRAPGSGNPRSGEHSGARAIGPHRKRGLRALLLAAGVGRALADPSAGQAALRLFGRALLAGLPAQGLRARPEGEAGALSPPGPPAEPRPSCRLPPGAERPLRRPSQTRREPAHGGGAADPGRQLEARADSRRGRVRGLQLPRHEEDRDPSPAASWQGPDRRPEAGLRAPR